jgi:hypothetical protein
MDHSHCFTNGREVILKHLGIDRIQEDGLYGVFPEFRPFLDRHRGAARQAAEDLRRMDRTTAQGMVDTIPRAWDVSPQGREALVNLIVGRAAYLAEEVLTAGNKEPRIMTLLWPRGELFPSAVPEEQT